MGTSKIPVFGFTVDETYVMQNYELHTWRPLTLTPAGALRTEIVGSTVTLNVDEINFGYVGLEDALGNKLVINSDGSINVAGGGGGGVASHVTVDASALPAGAATNAAVLAGNTTLTSIAGYLNGGGSIGIAGAVQLATGTNAIGGVTQAGTWNVGLTGALPAGSNAIGHVTIDNASFAVTGAFYQAMQPVSLATLPALVAGAAIIGKVGIDPAANAVSATIATDGVGLAKEAGGHLASIDATLAEIATDTDSLVTIASTQATAAKQDAGNTSLASIKTDMDSVVTNTTGLSTAANQTTELASLATIATNTALLATAANQSTDLDYQRAALALQRDSLNEQRSLRQLIAANAGGFLPMPEMFQLGAP